MRDIPQWADLVGIPFRHGARGPDSFDCLGLVAEMKRREGRPIPTRETPDGSTEMAMLLASQIPLCNELPGPRPGAIAAIRVGSMVRHVGYLLNDYEMLHAWAGSGGVTKERLDVWARRIVGYYEYAQ